MTIWKAQWRPRRKLIVVVVMLSQFRQHRESLPGPRLAFVATPRSESSRAVSRRDPGLRDRNEVLVQKCNKSAFAPTNVGRAAVTHHNTQPEQLCLTAAFSRVTQVASRCAFGGVTSWPVDEPTAPRM